VDFSGRFPGRHYAPLALRQGMLTLHLLLDRSSLEVFADDGARVLTEQIFPSAQSLGLQVYASGGTAALRRADLWDLDPARR
jgi:sucrose-6-phosphate hydrolase SacC (GH32 family)